MHEPILIKFYTFVYDLRMNIKEDKPNPTDIKIIICEGRGCPFVFMISLNVLVLTVIYKHIL